MKAASPGWPTCWTPLTGAVGRGSGCSSNPMQARLDDHPGRSADLFRNKHGAGHGACPRLARAGSVRENSDYERRSSLRSRNPHRPGRGHRLVPVAVRAAPRSGLSLGRHRSVRRRSGAGRLAPRHRPQPALRHQLLGDLHPAGPHRDRNRQRTSGPPAGARQRFGGADHRHGSLLHRRSLRPDAQPGVAHRGTAGARRDRRPTGRRGGLRHRLDPMHRPDAGGHPDRRRRLRLRGPGCLPPRRLLGRPRHPIPAHLDRFHPHDHGLRGDQASLPRDHGGRRRNPDRLRCLDPDGVVRHLQSLGPGPAQRARHQLVGRGLGRHSGWSA